MNTEPRALTTAEIAGAAEDGDTCSRFECGLPPESGTRRMVGQGSVQTYTIRTFRCRSGHTWSHESDGG